MTKTFYVQKSVRRSVFVCLLGFVAILIASNVAIFVAADNSECPPGQGFRSSAVLAGFIAFITLFWGGWIAICVRSLILYRGLQLEVDDGSVRLRRFGRTTELQFDEVESVEWRLGSRGAVKLAGGGSRIRIDFDHYEQSESLFIVRLIRNAMSAPKQSGWDHFCLRIATPLRNDELDPDDKRPLEPEEVRLTRARIDRLFVPAIVLLGIVGFVLYLEFDLPRVLIAPLLPCGFWVPLRFLIPRKGIRATRLKSQPAVLGRFQRFLLVHAIIALSGLAVLRFYEDAIPYPKVALLAFSAVMIGSMFARAAFADGELKTWFESRTEEAVREWDEAESADTE